MSEKILATIICPECDREWRDEAPGNVQCPNPECNFNMEVDKYGTPVQYTTLIICPNCGDNWHDEVPGPSECPNCKFKFEADAQGKEVITDTLLINCPECNERSRHKAPGSVICSACGHSFDIDEDGEPIYEEVKSDVDEISSPATQALNSLRHRLLDLTTRNRLLNYKESSRSIRIIDEDTIDEVFKLLVHDGISLELSPTIELKEIQQNLQFSDRVHDTPIQHRGSHLQTPFTPEPLERRCKKLLQESRTAIEETGSNMLFLSIGFVDWYEDESSSDPDRAPLILVPIRIERTRINKRTNCYSYVISYTGEDIETNLSLTEKFDHDFDLILPELDENVLPTRYLSKVEQTIQNKLRWSVSRDIILGMFSFAKILMFKDLDNDRWPADSKLKEHENVMRILVGKTDREESYEPIYGEEYHIDGDERSFATPLILDADSSQLSAIIDGLWKRKNIVVEGPPGTGKSQTIANLIAASLYKGMSVLFVAEKKAALDVVRSRLDNAGLGDFCLELHSHKTQKGQLHADIAKRLSQTYCDSEIIDHEIQDLRHELEKIRLYSDIVNKTVGLSNEKIYDIFWRAERLKTEIPKLNLQFSVDNALKLTRQHLHDRVLKLQEVARLREDLLDKTISAWKDFRPNSILPGDDEKIKSLMKSLKIKVDELSVHLSNMQHIMQLNIKFDLDLFFSLNNFRIDMLDQVPLDFDSAVGYKFLEPENYQIISELVTSINTYEQFILTSNDLLEKIGTKSERKIQNLTNATHVLNVMGYGDKTLRQVIEIINIFDTICSEIRFLESLTGLVQEVFMEPPKNFRVISYINTINQVMGKSPKEISVYAHPAHVLVIASDLLEKVKHECKRLSDSFIEHSKFFEMSLLPPPIEILSLKGNLQGYKNSFFSRLTKNYRKTKKTVQMFLVDHKFYKNPNLLSRLGEIAGLLREIEQIQMNEEYKKILGPLYLGIKTDWDQLQGLITWSQEFCEVVNSQKQASSLMSNINDVREKITKVSQKFQDIWPRIYNLLNKVDLAINLDATFDEECKKFIKRKAEIETPLKELLAFETLYDMKTTSIDNVLQSYLSANELHKNINGDKRFHDLLGSNFNGVNTEAEKFLQMANWVNGLRVDSQLPPAILSWLINSNTSRKVEELKNTLIEVKQFTTVFDRVCQELNSFGKFNKSYFAGQDTTLSQLSEVLTTCIDMIPYLVTWSEYCRACEEGCDFDLEPLVKLIEQKDIKQKDCDNLYRFIVYDGMAKEIIRSHPELASFTRANYENMIQRYVDLDKQIIKRWHERIAYEISKKNVPQGISGGFVSEYTELGLLTKEIQKRKRHIPIRQLVKRSGKALQALKPCFMMSPLSVAQYLVPGEIKFDMVIMDEASQIRPPDAIGAIARANQFVIVGDPNQLPPTSFFQRTGGEDFVEEESTAVEDMESILDICRANYQKRRLRWHYRSEHESLVAFSNHQFYDDDLIVFPAPHTDNGNYGIRHHYIEGAKYFKGRNRLEAESIADAIIEHFKNQPQLSLGVATFNREQADLIQDSLERRQKLQPWLEKLLNDSDESLEPFFIKNLENVQGDERDVIFISTTYGPDQETGIVYQRFGPISADTGWRRLNVIVTRAKKRVELFTSMRSTDVKFTPNSSRGVSALKAYLEYAEMGGQINRTEDSNREPGSDFEIAVARILRNHGYKVVPQVGVAGFYIDIGVKHPEIEEKYILGVECDGAAYHSAKSVRDRDRLRQEILKRKGWNIHRIWSTDWFKNREREVQRLLNQLKDIIEKEKSRISLLPKEIIIPEKKIYKKELEEVQVNLRDKLLRYNEENILPRFPDRSRGILREEMIEQFLLIKPSTKEDFYRIPMALREKTDGNQTQFLEDIFEIIREYTP